MQVEWAILFAVAAISVGCLVQSALGFGGGMLLVPVLLATHGPHVAIPVTLTVSLVMNAQTSRERPGEEDRRLLVWSLGSCALLGLPVGFWLARNAELEHLQVGAGIMVIFAAAVVAFTRPGEISRPRRTSVMTAGALVGMCTPTIGFSGPPMLFVCRRMPSQVRRQTLASAFLPITIIGAPLALAAQWDRVSADWAHIAGWCAIAVICQLLVAPHGRRWHDRHGDQPRFTQAATAMLAATGVWCLLNGLT